MFLTGLCDAYWPLQTVVIFLCGSEADDGVNDSGGVHRRQAVDHRDGDGVLLTVVTV